MEIAHSVQQTRILLMATEEPHGLTAKGQIDTETNLFSAHPAAPGVDEVVAVLLLALGHQLKGPTAVWSGGEHLEAIFVEDGGEGAF